MKLSTHSYFIISCIALLSYGNATRVHAQKTKPATNELDAQYTPRGSGLLSSSNSDKKNSGNQDYPTHIVKISPGIFFRSIFALQYEYHLSDNTSLCGGLGFNYNKDILFQSTGIKFINDLTGYKIEANEIDHLTIYKYGNFGGSLPYLYGGVKFYNSDANGYFELNYSRYGNALIYTSPFNNANTNTDNVYNITIVNDNTKVKFVNNVFGLKFGTQHNTESKIITTHEFYLTLGLNLIRRDVLLSTTAENSTQGLVVTYTKQKSPKNLLPFFNVGYSFGIGK